MDKLVVSCDTLATAPHLTIAQNLHKSLHESRSIMPHNKIIKTTFEKATFGFAIGAGCILGLSRCMAHGIRVDSHTYLHEIYDHIFELLCLLADGRGFEFAILQKRELITNVPIDELDQFIRVAIMYFQDWADLLEYQDCWHEHDLDYTTFLKIDASALKKFLDASLVYVRLVEHVLKIEGSYSEPCANVIQVMQIHHPYTWQLFFKPIFKLQRDGIEHIARSLPWRFVDVTKMLCIDLAITSPEHKFDLLAFDEWLDNYAALNVVHIMHFDCTKHYFVLVDILNILRKNCQIDLLTVMIVGEQKRATLCAIAAQIHLMEHLRTSHLFGTRDKKTVKQQSLEEIEILFMQWHMQEKALATRLSHPSSTQIVPYTPCPHRQKKLPG